MIDQKNVQRGDGAIVLTESFGALTVSDTPVSPSWCDEGGLQVALG